jgi:NTP pyrophosphatase (non-canonical NTP hydrolase)
MVESLEKPATDINLTPTDTRLMHAALGIAGEAGEVVDLIKKSVINGRPMDVVELKKELGDLEFYLTLLRSACDIDREVVLEMNIMKLRDRYPDGYSDVASMNRVDVLV